MTVGETTRLLERQRTPGKTGKWRGFASLVSHVRVVKLIAGTEIQRECSWASPKGGEDDEATPFDNLVTDRTGNGFSNTRIADSVFCVCGREFTSQRGMKIHRTRIGCLQTVSSERQRSIGVHETSETPSREANHSTASLQAMARVQAKPSAKRPRIKFPPASDKRAWKELDDFLCCYLDSATAGCTVKKKMKLFSEAIYTLCFERFGAVQAKPNPDQVHPRSRRQRLIGQVRAEKNRTRKAMRKATTEQEKESFRRGWYELKRRHAALLRAESVAQQKRRTSQARREFTANPFRFARSLLEEKRSGVLEVSQADLESHLCRVYTDSLRGHELVDFPGLVWPAPPGVQFDNTPIGWLELRDILLHKRNKSAPGPNGVPYLVYKKCRGVQQRLFRILRLAWSKKIICPEWQTSVGIFIPKESESSTLSQFRPISLLNVEGKLYFSALARRLSTYLLNNGYIDQSLQKGGVPGMSGCLEHATMIWDAIQSAKSDRLDLNVVWLDLANAYGSVPHSLILKACEQFHIPEVICKLIISYFDDLTLCFSTKFFTTTNIRCEVGIAQGCAVSPVLFVMAMQVLLSPMKKVMSSIQLGNGPRVPAVRAFMDDVTLLSSTRNEMCQGLTVFDNLVQWARMACKPKKSRSLSLTRGRLVKSSNFTIAATRIPTVAEQPIKSLGRVYDASLGDAKNIVATINEAKSGLRSIDMSLLRGVQKCWCYEFMLLPKLLWPLCLYDFPMTRVEVISRMVSKFLRRWLNVPPSLSDIALYGKCTKLKLPFSSVVERFKEGKVRLQLILRDSPDPSIRHAQPELRTGRKWSVVEQINTVEEKLHHRKLLGAVQTDRRGFGWTRPVKFTTQKQRRDAMIDVVREEVDEERFVRAVQQAQQGQWTRWEPVERRELKWSQLQSFDQYRLGFLIRGTYDILPTGVNLKRWGLLDSSKCPLCAGEQTLDHVLSACRSALGQGRYTWRHNQVLRALLRSVRHSLQNAKSTSRTQPQFISFVREGQKISKKKPVSRKERASIFDGASDWSVACDLRGEGHYPRCIAKSKSRPDLVISSLQARRIIIVELTVPFETRILDQHEYKIAKYEELRKELRRDGFKTDFFAVEVGARWVASLPHRWGDSSAH